MSRILHIWCWNVDTAESRSEVSGKFWNVVLEKNSWSDRVRNEEVLRRIKEEKNFLHTIKRRRANCIFCILRRNCLLKYFVAGKMEGRIEVTGRWRRRYKPQWMTLRKREDAGDGKRKNYLNLWRTRFGRGCGPVIRQTTWLVDNLIIT